MQRSLSVRIDFGRCPYLAGQHWHSDLFVGEGISPQELENLFEQGFQRLMTSLYVPSCSNCRECTPVRVDVRAFRPDRNQRRVWSKNQDLRVVTSHPQYSEEHFLIYSEFHRQRYPTERPPSPEHFRQLLEGHFGFSVQWNYWLGNQLIGFGVLDPTPTAASSNMFYWHQQYSRRRLGTFSLLREIEWCRATGRAYLYLGMVVRDCGWSQYKISFKPFELRSHEGRWARPEPGTWGAWFTSAAS